MPGVRLPITVFIRDLRSHSNSLSSYTQYKIIHRGYPTARAPGTLAGVKRTVGRVKLIFGTRTETCIGEEIRGAGRLLPEACQHGRKSRLTCFQKARGPMGHPRILVAGGKPRHEDYPKGEEAQAGRNRRRGRPCRIVELRVANSICGRE